MSLRYSPKISQNEFRKASLNKKDRSGLSKSSIGNLYPDPWVRPSDWLTMPSITSADHKINILIAVYEQGSNFCSFSCTGNYTVDWGDGTVENFSSGVQSNREYSYAALSGTDSSLGYRQVIATITPQSGQNLTTVNLKAIHPSLTASANTTFAAPYLEIQLALPNATSITLGGITAPIPRLLQSFVVKNAASLNTMNSLFYGCNSLENLELSGIGGNITSLSDAFRDCFLLQSVPLFDTSKVTTFATAFLNCFKLKSVPLFDTSLVTSFASAFFSCFDLRSIPLFNTISATNFSGMFLRCHSLKTVPLFNTRNVTNFSTCFQECRSLETIPLWDTSSGTTFASMFISCTSLKKIPLLNTFNALSTANMFDTCVSLKNIPLLDLRKVTNPTNMFSGCISLQSVPIFSLIACTNNSGMFNGCSSLKEIPNISFGSTANWSIYIGGCTGLKTIPLFNTFTATQINSLFQSCSNLETIPLINTSLATNATSLFNGCSKLTTVPALNLSNVTTGNFLNIFASCPSLTRSLITGVRFSISYAGCKISQTELQTIFTNLGIGTSQTITITGNWGAPTPVSLTGTPADGSVTITMASTTGLAVGMQVSGVNTSLTTGRSVTFTDVGDLVNLNNHGLSNGDEVSFSVITTTTGIVINTIYFVVGASTNTFQVAASVGGAALPLTTNGSGTVKYNSTIVSIVPNTSVTMSRPMAGGGAQTLSFRALQTYRAVLKGWTIAG
jgi:hypothetical protein